MFLTELFEQQTTKHAAFCFGRMNPPTVGHAQLINTVAKASKGGDYFVFVSQTQDKKKNPLDYDTKIQFIKALFPQQASHVVYNPELKTIMQVANWLYSNGYRSVTFVAGSDRLASFQELLTKYNGVEDGYNFDSINFVSSGDRDPDADGIAGVSASSARKAASQGNFELFAQATGAGKLTPALYQAVRKGMLLEGKEYDKPNPSELRDMYNYYVNVKGMSEEEAKRRVYTKDLHPDDKVNECSGYIPKNKKEARDPRWSNALTVDVGIDTPNKNLKAFRLG